ncbi:MAG: ADP-forming succinate--CoA ligase subunit beta [Deltaproteobacteria bacterium]|nr:ADP-forming succinate--CoA ligase subunit beta [Deltaproteobacteria bacterium]
MKIHEYQAKELFRKFGVTTPKGIPVTSPRQAELAARQLGTPVVVVKSQVHAGGRGKGTFADSDGGRGVRIARSPAQVREFAAAMLGKTLTTIQTGAAGAKVRRLYVEEGLEIDRELYLGMTLDRERARVTFMASAEGGVEIEEVAARHPEKIFKETVDPAVGFQAYQGRKLADQLGLAGATATKLAKLCAGLYKVYEGTDASLCEINPLVVLKSGEVVALDAKLNFDDNALFRHPELEAYRDIDEEDESEARAKEFDLNYITLSGNIGCMVNGAGLAMATMDTIKLVGGEPANFLDVGGSATKERVTEAFKLLLSDKSVKALLVNIFGGIMKCDVIAEGIVEAAKVVQLQIPLVVRLEGTNVEKGKQILKGSGLKIIPADNLREAAQKAIAAAK